MKTIKPIAAFKCLLVFCIIIFAACHKTDTISDNLKQTNTYPATVATTWMNMQVRVMSTTTLPNVMFARPYAYTGLTLYEAVVAGMPAYQSIAAQLNGLQAMPQIVPGVTYHWPSSANAALAYINKQMFSTTSTANKDAIDSLENAMNTQYLAEADAETISRSIAFGRAAAQKIFEWAETDDYQHVGDAYTAPIGSGLWEATARLLPSPALLI